MAGCQNYGLVSLDGYGEGGTCGPRVFGSLGVAVRPFV